MIIKSIASVLIIYASTNIGIMIANDAKKKIDNLMEMKKALFILKSEIQYNQSSLKECFEKISSFTKEPVSKMFENCLYEMQKKEKNIKDICSEEFRRHKKSFRKNDINQFISFADSLSFIDKNLQNSAIEQVIAYIDEELKFLQKEEEKNSKLFRSLGLLTGILFVILLI